MPSALPLMKLGLVGIPSNSRTVLHTRVNSSQHWSTLFIPGYCSILVNAGHSWILFNSGQRWHTRQNTLVLAMSKSLALYAFEVLCKELSGSRPLPLADFEARTKSKNGPYPTRSPLFVTWNYGNDLRGCIGTFQAQEVGPGLQQFALISALEDLRFSPIEPSELPHLSAHVTLLHKFAEIRDPGDWTVGSHGLKVLFVYRSRRYLGTFLPLVAPEQGWGLHETLWNLLRKAGLSNIPMSSAVDFYRSLMDSGAMKLERYEGLKCEATYQEYLELREGEA